MFNIDYAARRMDGSVATETVSITGTHAHISALGVDKLSLNLSPGDVFSYTREGDNLVLQLASGRTLVIEGYFETDKELLMSTDGQLTRVELEGEEQLVASYQSFDEGSGKWSEYDQLAFLDLDRIEPVVAPLAAAGAAIGGAEVAALGAGAFLASGVGGGSGGGSTTGGTTSGGTTTASNVAITGGVSRTGDVLNLAGHNTGQMTVTGTGQPGANIAATIGGQTVNTVVDQNGNWTATFDTTQIASGEYTTGITVVSTETSGATQTITDTITIDTLPETVTFDTIAGDNTINATEQAGAVTISGQSEAGASMSVQFAGQTQTTTVDQNGNWSVTYPVGSVPQGTYVGTATATVTDAAGNSASYSTAVQVDTQTNVVMNTSATGSNGLVNDALMQSGVVINGTGEPGATVTLDINGVQRSGVVGQNGAWQVTYENGSLPTGTYNATVNAQITDVAGNTATTSGTLQIDTEVQNFAETAQQGGADNTVSGTEVVGGVPLSGTVEPGSSVQVSFGNNSYAAAVDGSGNWSVTIPQADIPTGEGTMNFNITATDAAGNAQTIVEPVAYDTLVSNFGVTGATGNGLTVNEEMVAAGATIAGTVEPGSTVQISLGAITRNATVDQNGNWSLTYGANEIPNGTYVSNASIVVTDAAGNTNTHSVPVNVDTEIATPEMEAVTRGVDGVRAVYTQDHADTIEVTALATDGSTRNISFTEIDLGTETLLNFGQNVANGEQIVVAATDAAGNDSDTLLALDTTNTRPSGVYFDVDIDNAGLSGFDLSAIDLQFVNGGQVTLDEADLARLTGPSDTLTIHGGSDDQVVLDDVTASGTQIASDGTQYNVYTLGTDYQVVVDSDVNVVLV